ncbi:MAG: response regulator [bacterium]|nr:response regulator [bacterium]
MENKLTCLAIDDDATSLMLVSKLIEKHDSLSLLASYKDSIEAAAGVVLHKPDIIFLDVEMPEFTGLEMLESLVKHPKVIMITSKADYKQEASNQNVVEFLLKPLDKERFNDAVQKAIDAIEQDMAV